MEKNDNKKSFGSKVTKFAAYAAGAAAIFGLGILAAKNQESITAFGKKQMSRFGKKEPMIAIDEPQIEVVAIEETPTTHQERGDRWERRERHHRNNGNGGQQQQRQHHNQ